MTVANDATGKVGFSNSGYNGVPVNKDRYGSYFWIKGEYRGNVTISLVGPDGTVHGSSDVPVDSKANAFNYYETYFNSTQSPVGNNVWQLTFDASTASGSDLWFDLVQLFPVTYHQR